MSPGAKGNKADPSKDNEEFLEVKRKTKEEPEADKERFKKEGVVSCVKCLLRSQVRQEPRAGLWVGSMDVNGDLQGRSSRKMLGRKSD